MHILVVNNHSTHIHDIYKLFPIETYFTYISYRQVGGYDMSPFDCIILTGSSTHTFAYKAFAQEMNIIQNTNKPIVGIGLGCELIASTYGGIINKETSRIQGDLQIACKDDPKTYLVHEAHIFSITNLGNDIEGLGQSIHGYEIIKHKTKRILGFQFHPEVTTPSNDGLHIFMTYFPLLGIGKTS